MIISTFKKWVNKKKDKIGYRKILTFLRFLCSVVFIFTTNFFCLINLCDMVSSDLIKDMTAVVFLTILWFTSRLAPSPTRLARQPWTLSNYNKTLTPQKFAFKNTTRHSKISKLTQTLSKYQNAPKSSVITILPQPSLKWIKIPLKTTKITKLAFELHEK